MTLLRAIELHCRAKGISPSRFGREAANDPALVSGLRNGREPRPKTEARIRAYLEAAK